MTDHSNSETLIEVKDLKMYFPVTKGIVLRRKVGDVKAVDGLTFSIRKGETLGLVGESGCGKSTTGRALIQLYKPTTGEVIFHGTDLTKLPAEQMRQMRRKVQMIFQDPYASLNPRMTVGDIIAEPIMVHNLRKGKEAVRERVQELLKLEKIQPSAPLTIKEIEAIYFDVSMQKSISPLVDFVRRIENAHGIGIYHD